MGDHRVDGEHETLVQGRAFVILNSHVNRKECLERFLQLGPEFRERTRFGGIPEVLHNSSNELGSAGDIVQGRLVEVRGAREGGLACGASSFPGEIARPKLNRFRLRVRFVVVVLLWSRPTSLKVLPIT